MADFDNKKAVLKKEEEQVATVSGRLEIISKVSLSFRHYLSIDHIQAAALFSRLASDAEHAQENVDDAARIAHASFVIGSIMASVAFLEATINEVFADATDNPYSEIKKSFPTVAALMASLYGLDPFERASLLEKYQVALQLAGQPQFEKGEAPYQDVKLLYRLRNALVHYRPEWVTSVSDTPEELTEEELEKDLRGKFGLNPLTSEGNPFFPDKCLGHGCAKWGVISSISFTDDFFSRMGLQPTYDHVRTEPGPE